MHLDSRIRHRANGQLRVMGQTPLQIGAKTIQLHLGPAPAAAAASPPPSWWSTLSTGEQAAIGVSGVAALWLGWMLVKGKRRRS
jgi:hypothetical protein